ncbi:MAG: hypothetical protein K2X00_08385 [Nitrospiraceae bacterium]|nr:hypothetical protein [Nitrospiraceae bacterium]OQW65724.1 MAG: hypothetical protein BVN29_08875 [Nitrospira sp. ST-bin5]
MRIEDVSKLDWTTDGNLRALEGKKAALIERETQGRARLAELEKIVREGETSLVQVRAAILLDEEADEAEDDVQQRVSLCQQEMQAIRADLQATQLARTKLEPTIEAAASEARLRVAQLLLQPCRETAESLRALLNKAIELNNVLHAIHRHVVRDGIAQELYATPELKPLTMLCAWNELSQPNGNVGGGLQYWTTYLDKIFGERG